LTGGIVTWATVAGLGVVLAVFAAIGFGGALSGSRSAAEARRTGDLTAAYLRAQDGLSREDAIEDVYRLDPDPVLRRRFEAAVGDLDGALVTLLESGAARDRALARRARPLHDTYAQAMRDLFDAADRAEMARAEQINEERADPAQDELQRLIAGSGPDYALAQLRELGALEAPSVRSWAGRRSS
jgi:hypothetical protein